MPQTSSMPRSGIGAAKGVSFAVNLDCDGCARLITRSLKDLDGVLDVGINYVNAKVYVSYNPRKVTPDQIRAAIRRAGRVVL